MSKSAELPVIFEMTDAQLDQYAVTVDDIIRRRKQAGTLLSVFDLVAGAMTVYFMAGKADKIPAAWVFGMMRPDLLPQGVLDDAQDLERQMREISEAMHEIEDLAEDVASLSDAIKRVRTKLSIAIRKSDFVSKRWQKESAEHE